MATRDEVMEKFGGSKQVEAFAMVAHKENNNLRDWITQFKATIAAASSLDDLQTRVATLPNMPQRSTQQLIDAVDVVIDDLADYSWME